MQKNKPLLPAIILLIVFAFSSCTQKKISYESTWEYQPDRIWVGPEFWANRLQDWKIESGELICINSTQELRSVHLLTHSVNNQYGKSHIMVQMGINQNATRNGAEGWAGILLGAGENLIDYRASALIHYSPGRAGGIVVAVNENGQLIFLDNTKNREQLGTIQTVNDANYPDSLILDIDIYPENDSSYTISASAIDPKTKKTISSNKLTNIEQHSILGNIAIVANHIEDNFVDYTYSFKKLHISGTNLTEDPQHRFGPFMGVMHTLSNNTLKLTAQLPPIGEDDDQFVRFWYRDKGSLTWTETDSVTIRRDAFIAPFRIDKWDSKTDHDYRLSYRLNDKKGRIRTYYYSGTIAADPVDKSELVAAAFTGSSMMEGSINGKRCDYPERLWFPHSKLITSIEAQNPDILFFTGDQIYEGRPTEPDFSTPENTELDYLYKWYIFLWSTGDLMRNIPTICLPDDHDVYHGNIWGAGGIAAPAYPPDTIYPDYYKGMEYNWQQDHGGYKLKPETVNMIQATQTSHFPDPYDPTPVEQGIEVYYTALNYGRISFAILEDRKFKSSPSVMLPEARVVNGFAQNRYISGRKLDNPDAILLGKRQLDFINEWTNDWKGVDMKASVSQTIFANLSTYPASFRTDEGTPELIAPLPGVIPENYRKAKDMDSNGWPQTGRNKALKALRKGFTVMIGGDQHLGSLIQMGVDTWDDAGYSFCVPSIGNLWPRRWFPQEPGKDYTKGMPLYTGKYFDGFGNRMHVYAVANPVETGRKPAALYNRAVGYGIIKFNKPEGEITFECWRRDAAPTLDKEDMFPGWPRTISLFDNYSRPVRSWLPNYKITGLSNNPLFQVVDESNGEIVYSIRIPGDNYQPGVFTYGGEYTVRIGDPDSDNFRVFEHIKSRYNKKKDPVIVEF